MIPMAFHFGFTPGDINRLTIGEFEVYAAGLDEMVKQRERAEKEAGRPTRKR